MVQSARVGRLAHGPTYSDSSRMRESVEIASKSEQDYGITVDPPPPVPPPPGIPGPVAATAFVLFSTASIAGAV